MNPEETMVEESFDTETADDALSLEDVEEEDESESLESLVAEDEGEAPAEEPKANDSQGASEPGWIKQRVNKAVEKALAEQERRLTAQFEAQMAPIREKMLNDEARELVRTGAVKDLEVAKELIRYRQGMKPAATDADDGSDKGPVQQRNERGQFTSNDDAATNARIDMLKHQADRIRDNGGPDVIAEFQNNEDIKQKVIKGEMDFYDVADELKSRSKSRKSPSPMRSPNGASGNNPNAIESMTDEQFRRLEKRISEGARIRLS